MLVTPSTATAHPVSTFYPEPWPGLSLPTISWRFTSEFTGTAKRNRVLDGSQEWDGVRCGGLSFGWTLPDYGNYLAQNTCDKPREHNGIHWEELRGAYASTHTCLTPDLQNFWNFAMVFDSGDVWNTGTDNPTSSEIDMWHVATHEFGHGTAFDGEFLDLDACPFEQFGSWNTMCESVEVLTDESERGRKFRRSLESHDIHTFQAAY
jgi:hypothetical protein